jgi:hypothetical protein
MIKTMGASWLQQAFEAADSREPHDILSSAVHSVFILSSRVMSPGREADNLPVSSVKVKNVNITLPPPYVSLTWCSKMQSDKFTF